MSPSLPRRGKRRGTKIPLLNIDPSKLQLSLRYLRSKMLQYLIYKRLQLLLYLKRYKTRRNFAPHQAPQ
jgi:hypothetical protein